MRTRLPTVLAVLAMALAGCSGGGAEGTGDTDAAPAPQAEGEVLFVGTDNLQWVETSKQATLVDGALEVTIECEGVVPHNVVFEGTDAGVIADCAGRDTGSGTVTVEPGTYTYYCEIPGHRTAGMEGEITIS